MKYLKIFGIFVLILITGLVIMNFLNKLTNKHDKYISVYFNKAVSTSKAQILPVKRKFKSGQTPINFAISQLLKGPTSDEQKLGYYTEIPKQTKLLEIKEDPNTVTINLSKDFESGGGSESMVSRIKQVSYTALDAIQDKPVYLELNGKKLKSIGGEGVEVPQPLSRNLNRYQNI